MNLTKTPYLVLFTILIAIGAYAVTITIAGDLKLDGLLLDNTNSAGTSGQFLTSTGSGVEWTSTAPGSGTVTSVGSGTGLTGGPITSAGSLSIDTAVVPQLGTSNFFTNDMTVDGNLLVNEGSFTVNQAAIFNNFIDLTGTSAIDDDTIFFDDGTTDFLMWDESENEFAFSKGLAIDGVLDLTGSSTTDQDIIQFDQVGEAGSSLFWDDGSDSFVFTNDLRISSGGISTFGDSTVGGNLAVSGVASGITWNSRVPQSTTLTIIDSAVDGGFDSSITIGTDGLPVISYRDDTSTALKVVHCGNASCSSGNTLTTVDNAADVGFSSSITIGTNGFPVISYRDTTNTSLKVARCLNAICFLPLITTVDNAADVGRFTSITIGTDGFPVISYQDSTNDDLKVAHCENVSCTSGSPTITIVDNVLNTGTGTSIAIGTDGLPVISYLDGVSSNLKVAHCGDASCFSGNTLTTVDNAAAVGFTSSITIGTDGLPVISYQDSTNGDLKVAHCENVSCSSGSPTITIVDNAVNVGSESSITIGTDGFPVISYRDGQSNDLKVAHCTNTSCSTFDIPITVDFAVDLNDDTSIAIGTDGLPVISYFDDGGVDLKVAKCTNPYCLENWIRR